MTGSKRATTAAIFAVLCSASATAHAQSVPTQRLEVYNIDQLPAGDHIRQHRLYQEANAPTLAGCARGTPSAQLSPLLVPVVTFGFGILSRVFEAEMARRDKELLESLSSTYSTIRIDAGFPLPAVGGGMRCIAIHRSAEAEGRITSQAVYVFGLRPVGLTGFTVEPIAASLDESRVLQRQGDQANVELGLALQTVTIDRDGVPQTTALPPYTMSFEGLRPHAVVAGSRRRSPVMAVPRNAGPDPQPGIPTSIAIAVTESNTRLNRERQRIALEQANRAALYETLSGIIKTALTD